MRGTMLTFVFSKRSRQNIDSAHPLLRELARRALAQGILDMTVIEGHRDKTKQDQYYKSGASKLKWPKSKHNKTPSEALDIVPYPLDWSDWDEFLALSRLLKGTWEEMCEDDVEGTKDWELEWGGDWKMRDGPHFQINKKQ
jgi:peptidoglycan L-alanyl-D-glutamate endopeptidase CwlK